MRVLRSLVGATRSSHHATDGFHNQLRLLHVYVVSAILCRDEPAACGEARQLRLRFARDRLDPRGRLLGDAGGGGFSLSREADQRAGVLVRSSDPGHVYLYVFIGPLRRMTLERARVFPSGKAWAP